MTQVLQGFALDLSAITAGVADAAKEATLVEHDQHHHNIEYWFGKKAVQTATDWADRASLTPFRAISGNNDWGADPNDEAQVLGSDDTPVGVGATEFDIRRIQVLDVSNAGVFLLRIVWGTGTMADAIAAGQFTELSSLQVSSPNGQAKPADDIIPRLAVGTKVWVQAKNGTDNAWIDFLVGVHEYPAP